MIYDFKAFTALYEDWAMVSITSNPSLDINLYRRTFAGKSYHIIRGIAYHLGSLLALRYDLRMEILSFNTMIAPLRYSTVCLGGRK